MYYQLTSLMCNFTVNLVMLGADGMLRETANSFKSSVLLVGVRVRCREFNPEGFGLSGPE
jgi:hypothetical protein